jgi:predicted Mrr-cat superfamily restriction endonuclease
MPSPRESQPQLWTVWPGHDFDTTEHLDLQEQIASMAWDILDPTPYHDYHEYKQALQVAKPGGTEGWYRNIASQVWQFSHEIQAGDYIIMPMRRKDSTGQELFSLAVVLDNTFGWQPARKDGKLTRQVRWLYTNIPRGVMKPWRIEGNSKTVTRQTELTPALATAHIVKYVLWREQAQTQPQTQPQTPPKEA